MGIGSYHMTHRNSHLVYPERDNPIHHLHTTIDVCLGAKQISFRVKGAIDETLADQLSLSFSVPFGATGA